MCVPWEHEASWQSFVLLCIFKCYGWNPNEEGTQKVCEALFAHPLHILTALGVRVCPLQKPDTKMRNKRVIDGSGFSAGGIGFPGW